ncbi:hypothetical protein ACOJR9_14700 [Alteromonas sp. A081]|uniref:hypothetical protein n=1 Tax=Alteromonas sp. A081 TaxID=3410269 RepID=UPI003B97D6DB
MKIQAVTLYLSLLLTPICAADTLEPEVLSLSLSNNQDSEECPISGHVTAFIEYDLKNERYAELLVQILSENDVVYDTNFTLYNSVNTLTVELPYIDCATDVIASFN